MATVATLHHERGLRQGVVGRVRLVIRSLEIAAPSSGLSASGNFSLYLIARSWRISENPTLNELKTELTRPG